jgi:hypothetical protein
MSLAGIMAAVGLASNMAAMRALRPRIRRLRRSTRARCRTRREREEEACGSG